MAILEVMTNPTHTLEYYIKKGLAIQIASPFN